MFLFINEHLRLYNVTLALTVKIARGSTVQDRALIYKCPGAGLEVSFEDCQFECKAIK
jgi:hypothetical protein